MCKSSLTYGEPFGFSFSMDYYKMVQSPLTPPHNKSNRTEHNLRSEILYASMDVKVGKDLSLILFYQPGLTDLLISFSNQEVEAICPLSCIRNLLKQVHDTYYDRFSKNPEGMDKLRMEMIGTLLRTIDTLLSPENPRYSDDTLRAFLDYVPRSFFEITNWRYVK